MKIAVCGGRGYGVNQENYPSVEWQEREVSAGKEQSLLTSVLDEYLQAGPIEEIIHGGANGADTLAGNWAANNNIPCTVFEAAWRDYGKSAGFRRNIQIAAYKPDLLIAFPGGAGTDHMIAISKTRGIEVRVVE